MVDKELRDKIERMVKKDMTVSEIAFYLSKGKNTVAKVVREVKEEVARKNG